ncbi:MAG: phosphoadenosine phosphosulfate reductase family protein [Dissulfurispiraceae bacterium]
MEITEDKSIAFQSLEKKVQKSIDVILETERRFGQEDIALTWTGGKDSTTLLSLVRTIHNGEIPFRVFNIDTSVKFKEIYDFRDRLSKEWNMNLVILKHPNPQEVISNAKDSAECCYVLKAKVLDDAIKQYGVKSLMTAIRWDEHVARADEKYFSEREDHVRVNPILHFMEKDIWNYIRSNNIPYCELYDRGYRSLGCAPCTAINTGTGPERGGRAPDKEKIMKNLRELGYF